VRELRNVVQKAALPAHGCPIDTEHVRLALEQTSLTQPEQKPTLPAYVADLLEAADRAGQTNVDAALTEWVERTLYGQAIRLAEGDQTKVAKWLGVSRATVRERLLRYGLHPVSETDHSALKK
jgi:DNA-binding NtrC family response regulator